MYLRGVVRRKFGRVTGWEKGIPQFGAPPSSYGLSGTGVGEQHLCPYRPILADGQLA